ncbi:hypothetical protein EIZ41_00220 [Shigella sonnei]|nr:hypothetical protein [Shigella sonnei]
MEDLNASFNLAILIKVKLFVFFTLAFKCICKYYQFMIVRASKCKHTFYIPKLNLIESTSNQFYLSIL